VSRHHPFHRFVFSLTLVLLISPAALSAQPTDPPDAAGPSPNEPTRPQPDGETAAVVVETLDLALNGETEEAIMHWPHIAGSGPAVDRINEALGYERITGEPFAETAAVYAHGQHGWVDAEFTVNANTRGVLSLTLELTHVGAYPDTTEWYGNFDCATGESIDLAQSVLPERLSDLLARLNALLQERVAQAMAEHPPSSDPEVSVGADLYAGFEVTADSLGSFSIRPTGLCVHFFFGFAHVIATFEPDRELCMTSAELDGMLDRDTPLGRFW
jgi:hypothetical protein